MGFTYFLIFSLTSHIFYFLADNNIHLFTYFFNSPQKLPWLLPTASILAACGQYVCYFIDNAVQLELGYPWLSILLNIVRVFSLLHVLYGYILFLAVVLFVMYVTGASMKEFRGK